MPYLKTAGQLHVNVSEIWGRPSSEPEVEEAVREFLRYDDLTTQRELALMGE